MKILKFGGTSVANSNNILLVKDIIEKQSQNDRIAVVVSALSNVTDTLIASAEAASNKEENYLEILKKLENQHLDLVKELLPVTEQSTWLSFVKKSFNDIEDLGHSIFVLGELTPRIKDRITSYGEVLSSTIISAKLKSDGFDCVWLDSKKHIVTNSNFTNARVNFKKTNKKIQQFFSENSQRIVIVPGFIASDKNGNSTTLGRGGSDFTASIIASALDADELQIWTDVSGMMTADPRLVSNSKPIEEISFQEAMELSHFGAKVLYPPTIQPVMDKSIDLWIKNTFAPEDLGTYISHSKTENNNNVAVGISNLSKIVLLTLEGSGMVGIPGFSAKLFQCLSQEKINVILITQSSSEHSITVAIHQNDKEKAEKTIKNAFEDELKLHKVEPLKVEKSLAIIAIVGENMKSRSGVSGHFFSALGNNGINIRAIAQGSSEKNISVVISEHDVVKAVNVLHEEFFESEIKQVHLYLCGAGNVGKKLIQQIYSQNEYLNEKHLINLRIAGVSNSKKMLFNDKGLEVHEIEQINEKGENSSEDLFAQNMISKNLRNSVFVDVTANSKVVEIYEDLLRKSISIVACNKIAASSSFDNYKKLKNLAKNHNSKFFFETNVGAGLPIIGTINDLISSGDKITSIKAVLSGTLNFVFNNYDGTKSFAEIVKQAQVEGYTEPDPRLDLAGTDVARKILILAREAGYSLEFDEIANAGFLPEEAMQGSVEDFYQSISKHEDHFKKIYDEAHSEGKILKYVAEFKDGKAKVGLQKIEPTSDLFHLYGKDNIVILQTLRYSEQPLVIKGAGAGAEVTASGVFADIVRSV